MSHRNIDDTLKTDVAIVGGGIVGASAALALRRMGPAWCCWSATCAARAPAA
jgi:2-polyprenyl-6-methoxyphenol hydroxylase-like FAD-dependent oxidoreductase